MFWSFSHISSICDKSIVPVRVAVCGINVTDYNNEFIEPRSVEIKTAQIMYIPRPCRLYDSIQPKVMMYARHPERPGSGSRRQQMAPTSTSPSHAVASAYVHNVRAISFMIRDNHMAQ